jgi:branched-chain amino acid aminotransferase
LSEAFATGTAAVISPVGHIVGNSRDITIHDDTTGPVAKRLYDEITGIQTGALPDRFSWTLRIPRP